MAYVVHLAGGEPELMAGYAVQAALGLVTAVVEALVALVAAVGLAALLRTQLEG